MDLSQINDVKELKALAYDETLKQEVAQQNIRNIQGRLMQLESAPVEVAPAVPDDLDE